MKKFMHVSGLKKTPGHNAKETDIHLRKQYSKEYHNKRSNEWTRPFRYPMHYRCGCQAQVKLITGPDYKRLQYFGSLDEHSHANEKSKKLKHNQIVLIHESVVIAPNQSATKLRRNLFQAKCSPESYTHMPPSILRSIQLRVKTARDQLTVQQLDTTVVPESLGDLSEWRKQQNLYKALQRHNDPDDRCWACFSRMVFGFPPNICGNHLTGTYSFLLFPYNV